MTQMDRMSKFERIRSKPSSFKPVRRVGRLASKTGAWHKRLYNL
jgi:hypothetical protein